MGEAKRFSPLYVFAALYVAGVYAFVPLLLALKEKNGSKRPSSCC